MRLSIAILPIDIIRSIVAAGGGGGGNIIGNNLVLYNEDDGMWYAVQVDSVFVGPIFTGASAYTTPSPAPNHTVTLPCPQDSTTHVVGVLTDDGGQVVMYTEQSNAGGVGENLVLSGYTLIVFKDDGGAYTAIPS